MASGSHTLCKGCWSRQLRGVRPQAVAFSDVKTDDTAEARRRLARQFRKHKLEPQPATAPAQLSIPGLQPKPQRRLAGSQVASDAQPAVQSVVVAADVAVAAAALQQLERQFNLRTASPHGGTEGDSLVAAVQLPEALLLDGAVSEPGSEITNAIMRANDWRQVQSLVQEHGPALSAIHICACLTRMTKLQDSFSGDPQVRMFLQHLMDKVSGKQHLLEQRQACNVLWAVSKLQHSAKPRQQWLTTIYQTATSFPVQQQESTDSCVMRHAAQLAYSVQKLQGLLPKQLVQHVSSWVMDTSQAVLQHALHWQQQVHSQQKQQVLLPKPSLQQQHSPDSEQEQSAVQVSARDLATLAWSLASIGVQPSTAWLSAFASAVSCKRYMAEANYRDLSSLLWAVAKFSVAAPAGAAANSVLAAAGALLQVCQDTSFSTCDAQSTSNTLWALATLGQRPPVPWLNRLLQHLERSVVGSMQPQGLSNSLWALAALGVVPQPSCMSALLSTIASQMQRFDAQGVANTVWALAVLEQQPSNVWQAAFWRHSRPLLQQMTAQGLINCLWSVVRLGLQPPQEWVVDVSRPLLQLGVKQLNSQGLHNVLWAMARMNNGGAHAQKLLEQALQQTVFLLEQQQMQGGAPAFTIYELTGLLHTVSLLHAKQMAVVQHHHQVPPAWQPSAVGRSRSLSVGRSEARCISPVREDSTADSQLLQLGRLLQAATAPLLQSAGSAELSILFWSQANMVNNIRQAYGQAAELAFTIPRTWVDAWMVATPSCFNSASSRDLTQWLWCLAKRGVRPSAQWVASYQVASFRQMGKANSQDLSNMLWAMASLGVTPEPAWLQQLLQEVTRCQAQKQLSPQHMANLGWALAKLGHRPDRDWLSRYQEDVCAALLEMKPQELANVLWSLAVLNCKPNRVFISKCLAMMSERLDMFKANEVAVALWAVARLRGQPDLHLMAAALQHCFTQARQLSPKGLSMLMWSVSNMSTPPPKAWIVKLLVATQVRMAGFSAQELSMLAVSLARLEYRPSDTWLDSFAAAAAALISDFEAQGLANTLWALATLHYTPSEEWMSTFDTQLQQHLASFTPAHTAMTMWAISRLQWLPEQPLWQQLQDRAELHTASYCSRSIRMMQRAVRVLDHIESEEDELYRLPLHAA